VKKLASLAAKTIKLNEKVDKLSEANTAIYQEELFRLMSGASASSGAVTTSSDGKKYVTTRNSEDFRYELTEDGAGVVITGMNKPTNGDYYNVRKIPAKIEGYPVVEVRKFNYQAFPISVSFPDTVTALGEDLFDGRVTSVKLPPKITVIPARLFAESRITEITIPNGVTRIEIGAFSSCKQLTKVTIPDSVTEIGQHAFGGCSALTTVTIPDSVTEIGRYAFEGCSELTTVKLPAHSIQYTAMIGYLNSADTVLREDSGGDFVVIRPNNAAFSGCGKLNLAMRKAITDSGYEGSF
jgi:hypothetical protein